VSKDKESLSAAGWDDPLLQSGDDKHQNGNTFIMSVVKDGSSGNIDSCLLFASLAEKDIRRQIVWFTLFIA